MPDHMKGQMVLSAPSASLLAPSCGSAGGHSVGSRHGAGAHLAGGSGRSHKGGTKDNIVAMGSILDCMTDMMENQNLLYQVPVVDEVTVTHHHVKTAIQADNLDYYSMEEKAEIINYIITNTTAATYKLLDEELHRAWLHKSALSAASG